MDYAKVDYSNFKIVQKYEPNEKPGEIVISRGKVTISYIDDVNMYPYIKPMII